MSTIKHLALVLALSSFAAACTSSDAAPAPQDPTTAKPANAAPTDAELHALCVEVMTRMRTCTDQYIPSLVDARARVDKPAGIAAEVAKDRDAVIAAAKEEWKTDSTDEAIAGMCKQMKPSTTEVDEVAEARTCVAKPSCEEFTTCMEPSTARRIR